MGVEAEIIALAQGGDMSFEDVNRPVDSDTSQRADLLQRGPASNFLTMLGKPQEELDNLPPLAQLQVKELLRIATERLAAGDISGCTNRMLRARSIAYRFSAMNLLGELDNRVEQIADYPNHTHEAGYASRHVDGESEQDSRDNTSGAVPGQQRIAATALSRVISAHDGTAEGESGLDKILGLAWSDAARDAARAERRAHEGGSLRERLADPSLSLCPKGKNCPLYHGTAPRHTARQHTRPTRISSTGDRPGESGVFRDHTDPGHRGG